ncbi:hypothetical protein NDU88_006009 [Pleurodeles waltl]|uniref:Secreted protein n=1 Tax=Pleurodeles waltl TaxID=8319 RepID=A0AAV7RMQ4_PLEWA|nr:hypothetical protein NDU88_006009 [Pleurodeles waltl]
MVASLHAEVTESRAWCCWIAVAGAVSGAWSLAAGGEMSRWSSRETVAQVLETAPRPVCQEYRTSTGTLPPRPQRHGKKSTGDGAGGP